MIKSLTLKNFVLFENETIHFKDNTNALLGETGAGKSVIFSAISVLCGQRNISKLIMKSKEFYELEMILDLSKISSKALLEINSIIGIEDLREFKVYRKLDKNGKGIIKINDINCSINDLKKIMSKIINIHSQDSVNEILKTENHINIIDSLISEGIKDEYYKNYKIYESQLKKVQELNKKDENKEEILEILDFKIKSLSKIENIIDEDELEKQKEILSNKEEIENKNKAIEESLNKAYRMLSTCLDNINSNVSKELEEKINNIYYELEEVSFEHSKTLNFESDYNIDEVIEQLNDLKTLKRKYSLDFEGLKNKYELLKEEKKELENISFEIIKEEKELNSLKNKIDVLASKISLIRYEKANELENIINEHFSDLAMDNAKVKIEIKKKELSFSGFDDVNIFIKTNKGHDYEIINEIASGGEKSRIMLILKMSLNKFKPNLVYLLDEIDQGISSFVASKMGDKILEFSKESQIIIISHTIQVINKMEHIYEVTKDESKSFASSYVKGLNQIEKEEFVEKFLKI